MLCCNEPAVGLKFGFWVNARHNVTIKTLKKYSVIETKMFACLGLIGLDIMGNRTWVLLIL